MTPEKAAFSKCVVLLPRICDISKVFGFVFIHQEGKHCVNNTGFTCNENRTIAGSGHSIYLLFRAFTAKSKSSKPLFENMILGRLLYWLCRGAMGVAFHEHSSCFLLCARLSLGLHLV